MKRKSNKMNESQATVYLTMLLDKKGLLDQLGCQVGTLLKENRRTPNAPYALKSQTVKGNRHRFGFIPFIVEKGKAMYEKRDLDSWFVLELKSHAEMKKIFSEGDWITIKPDCVSEAT